MQKGIHTEVEETLLIKMNTLHMLTVGKCIHGMNTKENVPFGRWYLTAIEWRSREAVLQV